jgi:hypothetical protein
MKAMRIACGSQAKVNKSRRPFMSKEIDHIHLMDEDEADKFDDACQQQLTVNRSWVLRLLQASDVNIRPLLEPLLVNYAYLEQMKEMHRLFLPADITEIYQQFNQSNQGG